MNSLNTSIIIKRLKAHGFEQIGSGYFSVVLAKPGSDRVIKVCTQADRSMDYYVWSAKQGYAGNIGPRVYSIRHYRDGAYVAVMERLHRTVSRAKNDPSCRWVHVAEWNAANNVLYSWMRNEAAERAADTVWPGICDFMRKLRGEFGALDLHDENWMLREDGSLVCTDPVSYGRSKPTGRLRSRDLEALYEMKLAA